MPRPKPLAALALLTLLAACSQTPAASQPVQDAQPQQPDTAQPMDVALPDAATAQAPAAANPHNIATAKTGWYRGDLHYHTAYSEEIADQGDDVATALAIADAYRGAAYLLRFPERAGDGLDFQAITDHESVASITDPGFHSDHLIVLPGIEYAGGNEANMWGIAAFPQQKPLAGQTQNATNQAAFDWVHAQGGAMGVNHPALFGGWIWDADKADTVEIWNSGWSLLDGELTPGEVAAHAGGQHDNPYIRAAAAHKGGGTNAQGLRFWQSMLSHGLHPAPVGGSDRHILVPAGLPTTYVRRPAAPAFQGLEGQALGAAGILAGLREGGTFVSRSPHGPQVLLEAEDAAGVRHPMGADLPAPGSYTIHARVTRAAQGVVRFVSAPMAASATDEPEPQVVFEHALDSDDVSLAWSWPVPVQGAWLHAIVLEPRIAGPLTEAQQKVADMLAVPPAQRSRGSMVTALLPILDVDVMVEGAKCDPAKWDDALPQCVPEDAMSFGTFFFPDALVRLACTWFEQDQPTPWSLGAVSAAFVARPPGP